MVATWTRQSLITMLQAGYTIADIANRYKVSRQRVLQKLQAEGLWRNKGHQRAKRHEGDLPLSISALGSKTSFHARSIRGTQI